MAQFINTLKQNAFDNLNTDTWNVDIHGWMDKSFESVFSNAVNGLNTPLTIVEVGTWKGLSTTTMARVCKELKIKDFNIIAIDTWLGAPEFWTWGLNDPTRGISLNCSNGWPTVFYTFTKNVKKLGHADCIAPFPIASTQGADVLNHYKIQADIIYVDAAHEYEPVLSDIKLYWPLLKAGGTMIGDDYMGGWPGVIKAVNEFCQTNNLKLNVNGVVWSINKKIV